MNQVSHNQIDYGRLQMNRRRFVGYCAATGLASTLFPEALTAVAQDANEVTIGMIAEAEKIAGLKFNKTERESIVKRLNGFKKTYDFIRSIKLNNAVPPALVFNPVLPGMTFSRERKPFTINPVDVSMRTLHRRLSARLTGSPI